MPHARIRPAWHEPMSESASPAGKPRRLSCARCAAIFECGSTVRACWCMAEDFRVPMPPGGANEDCLCPACLHKAAADRGLFATIR